MTTVEAFVETENDDAYQHQDDSGYERGLGFLFARSAAAAGTAYNAGMRFDSIDVPRGALIESAVLEVYCSVASLDDANVVIHGEDLADVPGYPASAGADDVNDRTRTTAGVAWVEDDTVGGSAAYADSPDLAAIVQEIVNRDDWTAVDAMGILLDANTDVTKTLFFDSGSKGDPPKLTITYSTPTQAAARYHNHQRPARVAHRVRSPGRRR